MIYIHKFMKSSRDEESKSQRVEYLKSQRVELVEQSKCQSHKLVEASKHVSPIDNDMWQHIIHFRYFTAGYFSSFTFETPEAPNSENAK
jgi:hypothetical protein